MISLLKDLLSKQDPTQPHTPLTRVIVSFCICLTYIVLHGFYGLLAAIIYYLLGVELIGLPQPWVFYPFLLGILIGCGQSFLKVRDYWKNYGRVDT